MSRHIQSVAEIAGAPSDLLVALASSDGEMVDEHFGSAAAFYLYRLNAASAELVAEQRFGQERK